MTVEVRGKSTATYQQFNIYVIRTAMRIFKLLHRDELLYTELDPLFGDDVIRRMMEDGIPLTSILKRSSFLPRSKLMITILHHCYLRLLGSFDQVSTNQQMLLAGLASDHEINWERAFISHLLVEQKVFLRENMIKLEGNVSSIILEALKGQDVLWYNFKQVPSSDRMLQFDALALHHMGLMVTAPKTENGGSYRRV